MFDAASNFPKWTSIPLVLLAMMMGNRAIAQVASTNSDALGAQLSSRQVGDTWRSR